MDASYARLSHAELFDRVVAGLGDEHDIGILCGLMLTKLLLLDPDGVGRRLDPLLLRRPRRRR